MAKPKTVSYEESRKQRLEENRKRMEALNLPQLSLALKTSSSPKSSPMKRTPKPKAEKQMVVVRRSSRVANLPSPPVYKETEVVERVMIPRRYSGSTSKHRDLSNRVYASYEDRMDAMAKAEKLESDLGSDYPTLVKTMLQSHVTGGFWLGLQVQFCKDYLSKKDEVMTLVDEDGNEYETIYLARKTGLSGGWKGFAVAHDLVDGDAVVFQLIKPTTMKVYIIRVERKA
ncbi:B3 domain-containing protein At5g42700 [Rosa rugosa]|uniref:B3 domain-containing protein At5g42700 n=1 Tax=Rosa rugosa TaxID=74645 RepID=UPI002B409CD9|nr:B3 domain-containing protein At5g42700 [Rosa rugosa]XP_062024263.1 B3 domain-containing protein At5g42700 [Rosa rugosa]